MDDAARKKLWRKKKAEVKELFRKYEIREFRDDLLHEQIKNPALLAELWNLGFSTIYFWICLWIPELHSAPMRQLFINRCEGGLRCETCISPEAHDIAQVYSDELYDRLPENEINCCKWLWLHIDRQNWTPKDFNFVVEPRVDAHSKYTELNTGISPRIIMEQPKERHELP